MTNASGAILYCVPSGEPGTPFGEACPAEQRSGQACAGAGAAGQRISACPDGGAAALNGEGTYLCGDSSEPRCPEGYDLTLSESGTALVCDGTPPTAASRS